MIIVKPHSFVDVITNSSTVIYTQFRESAVNDTYELIDEVLKVAGSRKKARDLFDVSIYPDMDRIMDNIADMEEDELQDMELSDIITAMIIDYHNNYTKEKRELLIDFLNKDDNWKKFADDDGDYDTYINIIAKDKTKSTKDLGAIIANMFDCDASYEG